MATAKDALNFIQGLGVKNPLTTLKTELEKDKLGRVYLGIGRAAKDITRIAPRLGSEITLSLTRQKELRPATKLQKFIFGSESIQDVAETGKELFREFGAKEETAQRYGPPTETFLAVASVLPNPVGKIKPGQLKTVVREGGITVERSVDDVTREINQLKSAVEKQTGKKIDIIQSTLTTQKAQRDALKTEMSAFVTNIRDALKTQSKDVRESIRTQTRLALPSYTRLFEGEQTIGLLNQFVRGKVSNIRELQTELDTLSRAFARKEVVKSPEIEQIKTQLNALRASMKKLPKEATEITGEIRTNLTRIRQLEKAVELRYDPVSLRRNINDLSLGKFFQPEEGGWGLKARLLGAHIITPADAEVRRMGKAGNFIIRRENAKRTTANTRVGQFLSEYRTLRHGLTENDVENGLHILEGRTLPESRAGIKMVQYLRSKFDEAINEGQRLKVQATLKSGKKVDVKRLRNFAPHILDFKKLEQPEVRARVMEHLVRTGQVNDLKKVKALLESGISETEVALAKRAGDVIEKIDLNAFQKLPNAEKAKIMLNKFIQRQRLGGAFFGSMSRTRTLDLPPEALVTNLDELTGRYFGSVYDFLEHTHQFGQANEKVAPFLREIQQSHGQDAANFARDFILNMSGGEYRRGVANATVDALRSFIVFDKMGLSVIPNSGQLTLNVIKDGLTPTIKEITKLTTKDAQEFALQSGAVAQTVINDIYRQYGSGRLGDFTLSRTGFKAIEKSINRVGAANIGRHWLKDMYTTLSKGEINSKEYRQALVELEHAGIPSDKLLKFGPNFERFLFKAAQHTVNVTQFGNKASLPLGAQSSSPFLRLLYQLKTFPLQAAQFGYNEIAKQAAQGNFAPLIRTLTIAPIPGEILNDISSSIKGKERTTSPVRRYVEDILYLGVMGIFIDTLQGLSFGKGANFILGPALGTGVEAGEATVGTTQRVIKEGEVGATEVRPLSQFLVGQIPTAGIGLKKEIPGVQSDKERKRGFVERRTQPFTSLLETLENVKEGNLLPKEKKKKPKRGSL